MVSSTPVLTSAIRSNILAIRQAERLVDQTTQRLASGLEVNSAIEDAQNFFEARSLRFEASDISRRLDSIGQGIRTVEQAQNAITATSDLLDQSEAIASEALEKLRANNVSLSSLILDDDPLAYWALSDSDQADALENQGTIGASLDATAMAGVSFGGSALHSGANGSAVFDGTGGILIPSDPALNGTVFSEFTIEATFNVTDFSSGIELSIISVGDVANVTAAYVNTTGLAGGISLTNGRIDAGAVEAGTTYHLAYTFDTDADIMRLYLDGEEVGSQALGTGTFLTATGTNSIGFLDDVASFYFNGSLSDVAFYDQALSVEDIEARAAAVANGSAPASGGVTDVIATEQAAFNDALDQIQQLVADSTFRGLSLLDGDNLNVQFSGNNAINVQGADFIEGDLGISRDDFTSEAGLQRILGEIGTARVQLENYAASLSSSLNIITTRQDFSNDMINTLRSASSDLIQADQNEEGANLLASQTRIQLAVTSLSLAAQSNSQILSVIA